MEETPHLSSGRGNLLAPLNLPPAVPKVKAPQGRLDVEDDRLVYVLPRMVAPWKFRDEAMLEEVICAEYERMAAFIEAYQAREEAAARIMRSPGRQKRYPPGSPTFRQVMLPSLTDASPLDTQHHVQPRERVMPRFIRGTIEQKQAFWDVIDAYRRHRAAKVAADRERGVCPYDFNQAAAGRPELLEQRHVEWVRRRAVLHDVCDENRRLRQDEAELHILESTTAFRIERRHREQAHAAHREQLRRVLPMVLAVAAAQWLRQTMWLQWQNHRRHVYVRKCAMRWRHQTQAHVACCRHAARLRHWLHESVRLKTIAHRVFYALRVYLRRVTLVQSLWRQKMAIRQVQLKRLEVQWRSFVNTPDVNYDPSKRLRKGLPLKFPYPEIDPAIRHQVLLEAWLEYERQCRARFRAQEADLLPHLIQSLQGLHPDKSRAEVRAIAARHFILGSVLSTLQLIPGALAPPIPTAPPSRGENAFAILPLLTKAYQVQHPNCAHAPPPTEPAVLAAIAAPKDHDPRKKTFGVGQSSRSRTKK
ncbi:hypothetical protein H310_02999 [Aphanomyces invadans]|uniref:Uncharacterized protein n=1 Tax=Aphanomyces invadans TaxID=157072 RepID=A0A024UKB2_9STRA|nr:hypothetical protein H310_02999 [Aphanomyces invadans]ETW06866.1 hypothetical protein H310_02999 [Aphanomyces invadans]|eukprot:XP_008864941.1 hypothetical protein H310_02999 [Aphanomyces invadans]